MAHCTSGTQIRDFLYVEDVADAFVELVDSTVEGPINIASGRPMSLMEVIYNIADMLGKRELVSLGSRPMPANETPLVVADISRLSNELGWKPQYDLDTGLNKTIEWWKNNIEVV
jgi:nucleoside-diphosphate-sugar epimerase